MVSSTMGGELLEPTKIQHEMEDGNTMSVQKRQHACIVTSLIMS